ncbi:MAG: hypothetical protein HIU82_18880 [Proteobacteria bacterium]|nr:hypothetical protein [Pseudomonadota bacterium]
MMVLLLGACVLAGAAVRRGAEYDEAYSLFVVAGTPRPDWPAVVFTAARVRRVIAATAGPARIAAELRATDVHPPLYFWVLAAWRRLVGPGLRAARALSVLAALAALAAVGAIAVEAGVPPVPAMLFTLGCYGFAYTGAIARNFALAEALALAGVWLVLRRRDRPPGRGGPAADVAAGLLLGAACFTNYLAAFTAAAVVLALCWRAWHADGWRAWRAGGWRAWRADGWRARRAGPLAGFGRALACLGGLAVWLPVGLWFLLAQGGSRPGQFPPFRLGPGLVLLGRDAAGAIFGGLPLYAAGPARAALGAGLAAGLVGLVGLIAWRWRGIGRAEARGLLTLCAAAPAAGLLALGLACDSTPIELRYLAFATPFFALLLAGALARQDSGRDVGRPACRASRAVAAAVLAVQALALAGLLTRPETMQPARAAAGAAARLAGRDGRVLLPRGNDGVGVVGPFLLEAPPWLRVRLVTAHMTPAALRAAAAGAPRVVLAPVGVDRESRATVAHLQAAFAGPGWRVVGAGFDALALVPTRPASPR